MGLVVRDHVMVLLRQALGRGSARAVDASWEELNRRYVSSEGQRLVSEQQLAVLQVRAVQHNRECRTPQRSVGMRRRQQNAACAGGPLGRCRLCGSRRSSAEHAWPHKKVSNMRMLLWLAGGRC